MAADFIEVLDKLGLAEYANSFINEGFDTWETLTEITESDLQDLNVKLGHRRKLQKAIAEYKEETRVTAPGRNSRPVSLGAGHGHENADSDSVRPGSEGGASNGVKRTKRKYRRHPKNDVNAPVKPVSAYVLFSNDMRESLKSQDLSFTDMAKIVGERWQVLPTEKREQYERTAQTAKDKYHTELAQYKKTPEHAQYQDYLTKWKAKHATTQEGKRTKLSVDASDDGNGSAEEPDSSFRQYDRGNRGSISSNVSGSTGLVRELNYSGTNITQHSPPPLPRDYYSGSTSSLATTPSLSHSSSTGSSGYNSSNPSLLHGNPHAGLNARRSPTGSYMSVTTPALTREGTSHTSHGSSRGSVRSDDPQSPNHAGGGYPNSPFSNMTLADRTHRILPPPSATGKPSILPPLDRRDGKAVTLPSLRDHARGPIDDPLAALIRAGEIMASQNDDSVPPPPPPPTRQPHTYRPNSSASPTLPN